MTPFQKYCVLFPQLGMKNENLKIKGIENLRKDNHNEK